MPAVKLEEVFKLNGLPTHTFVEPIEYPQLLSNLRTPGRGLVIEGPSGIGKTTAVTTALRVLGLQENATKLSARRPADAEQIRNVAEHGVTGFVIVDDFHKLPVEIRQSLADQIKLLADTEAADSKLILIGINSAGRNLIEFAHDLVHRLDVIRFDSNPQRKVRELIQKGESALNCKLNLVEDVVGASEGSFYLTQMMCKELCLNAGILEKKDELQDVSQSFAEVSSRLWERLSAVFRERCERFCRGSNFQKSGRAPYLNVLHLLATCGDWTLDLQYAIHQNDVLRSSLSQLVDRGYLCRMINEDAEMRMVLHYDELSDQITIDDPQFLFYIRQIPWRSFTRKVGFVSIPFRRKYDFALSFARNERPFAELLFKALQRLELSVFYDYNEQHRIVAKDIEEYLRPIYQSEAQFVVVVLGDDYPKRVWTRIESEFFRARLESSEVIPVWTSTAAPSVFDVTGKRGGFELDPAKILEDEAIRIASTLAKVLENTAENMQEKKPAAGTAKSPNKLPEDTARKLADPQQER